MTRPAQPASLQPPTRSRHVAFDWGGVFTIGTFDGRSTGNVAERTGVSAEQVRQSYFRHVRQLEVGAWTLPQFWDTVQGESGASLPYAEFEAHCPWAASTTTPRCTRCSRRCRQRCGWAC